MTAMGSDAAGITIDVVTFFLCCAYVLRGPSFTIKIEHVDERTVKAPSSDTETP